MRVPSVAGEIQGSVTSHPLSSGLTLSTRFICVPQNPLLVSALGVGVYVFCILAMISVCTFINVCYVDRLYFRLQQILFAEKNTVHRAV